MKRKGALHTDSMKDLPHRETSPSPTPSGADNDTVKYLGAFSAAFNNSKADSDGITSPKLSDIGVWLKVNY